MKKPFYILLTFCLAAVLAFAVLGLFESSARAGALSQAQVVIQRAPGDNLLREISFSEPISGLAALELTGIEVITADLGWGVGICSIGGVGCPADNCFCSSDFWNYSYHDGQAWQGYLVGAAESQVPNGGVEGWRWGPWDSGSLPPLEALQAAQQALGWLEAQQVITTGGYGAYGSSAETLLAVGANGLAADGWQSSPDGYSLGDYFRVYGASFANRSADAAGKLAVASAATDGCWPAARQPSGFYNSETGAYADGAGPQAWAMLGVSALSQTIPGAAADYLKGLALNTGAWEWGAGFGADTNSTALAIQALAAAGEPVTSSIIVSGLNFLASAQNSDGGFAYDPNSAYGRPSDADSTAYVIQAILASGNSPLDSAWVISSTNPISYLLGLQLADGSLEWQAGLGANLLATQQAIPALMFRAYPLAMADLPRCPAVFLPNLAAPERQ